MHSLAYCVPPLLKQKQLVQEYQPVVHRLRLRLSEFPINPGRTSLPQETLVIRWTGFSPVFRYHTGILTSKRSSRPHDRPSTPLELLPLHLMV